MARRSLCPCGTGLPGHACCSPYLAGEREPETTEQLMRSRYTANVVQDAAYLLHSWHPGTRPDEVTFEPRLQWRGLEVRAARGGAGDERGTVEFVARYELTGGPAGPQPGRLHETSRFSRREGRWVYLRGRLHEE